MKLTSFMSVLKTKKTPEDRAEYIKEHIKNEYIPYEKKADTAKAIVKTAFYQKDGDREVFKVDSVAKYMLICISILDLYTTIERNTGRNGNMLEEFNQLNAAGIFDILIQHIDQRELKEFHMVLDMVESDEMTNNYEPHAFIQSQVERFGTLIGATLEPVLKSLDINQICEMVTQIQGEG